MVKGSDCAGGKKSKEHLTVALCVNASGEIEKPLVIGKSLKPRCFKNVNTKKLPVLWTANRKAWMTSDIFQEWLKKFNVKMQKKKRHVLLLLDNAPCYPADLELAAPILFSFRLLVCSSDIYIYIYTQGHYNGPRKWQ